MPKSASSSESSAADRSFKRVFVAGATGFTGRALAAQDANAFDLDVRLQVRPGSKNRASLGANEDRIVDVDIADHRGLVGAFADVDVVVQLIGTVAARFGDDGDYEAVDYGTTAKLIAAAQQADVGHFVLLSSIGAGTGVGPYLAWKKKTEKLVKDSGLPYTILRPSYLAGDDKFPERAAARNTSAFFAGLSDTPFGAPFAWVRPINIQVLARLILHVCATRGPRDEVLTGANLFPLARKNDLV